MDVNKIFELKATLLKKQVELVKSTPEDIRGRARESLIQDFLEPFLPQNLGIDGGAIFSSEGTKSGEVDIIIYDKHAYSMFRPFSDSMSKKSRPFPPECVYGVIEVESHLKEKDLLRLAQKIQKIKKFPKKAYYPQDIIKKGVTLYDEKFAYFPILGMVFALNSSNLDQLLKKLKEINKQLNIPIKEQIDLIVVLDNGMIMPYDIQIKKLDFPQHKNTEMKIIIGTPEGNLRLFYLGLMKYLSQAWTRPISILDYFQKEDD